jgi:hypothetical protein
VKNRLALILALAPLLGSAAPLSANGLELSQDASRFGDLGLEAIYTGNRQKNSLVRDFVPSQDRLVVEFFIRVDNQFRFGRNGGHDILQLKKSGQKKPVASVKFLRKGDTNRLQFRVRNGKKYQKIRTKLSLPSGEWVRVTLDLKTASAPNAPDGALRILKNQEEKHLEADLDNDDQPVDSIRLGQVGKPPANWEGEIYFDELVIRKSP